MWISFSNFFRHESKLSAPLFSVHPKPSVPGTRHSFETSSILSRAVFNSASSSIFSASVSIAAVLQKPRSFLAESSCSKFNFNRCSVSWRFPESLEIFLFFRDNLALMSELSCSKFLTFLWQDRSWPLLLFKSCIKTSMVWLALTISCLTSLLLESSQLLLSLLLRHLDSAS